jgi:hypothetical protein
MKALVRRVSFLICLVAPALALAAETKPSVVKIEKTEKGYQLMRNGQPFFIKGGCGDKRHLEQLKACGGNSVRFNEPEDLDLAHKNGLAAEVDLGLPPVRRGADYGDPKFIAEQKKLVREKVLKLKDHPAVLIWEVGNEPELKAPTEMRIKVWKVINETAKMVKELDPNHPVVAVIASVGQSNLKELNEYCPDLDGVGINAYQSILGVPEAIEKQGWKRPWFITEFGPRGHWEVPKTSWGLPIEDTSTDKCDLYTKAYAHAVEGRPNCLGSYVFEWGQKQEKTHTWYGVFLPGGERLGAVDVMIKAWNGKAPENLCPVIGAKRVQVKVDGEKESPKQNIFTPGQKLQCTVDASDPEGQPLKITWDLRKDASDNPADGGDYEAPVPPIEGSVVSSEKSEAVMKLPETPGNYRIFVYAVDPKGSAATANVPIKVK